MPAVRSSDSKGKGKQQEEVDRTCEICEIVLSRKSDLRRHAKTHGSDEAKRPCTAKEGCPYTTWEKSNLETHMRRHREERICVCTDDPECRFDSCDPSSFLRHRKELHGYCPGPRAPRGQPKKKKKKPRNVVQVPVQAIRGVEEDSLGPANVVQVTASAPSSFVEASTSRAASYSWHVDPSLLPTAGPSNASDSDFFSEDWQFSDFVESASGLQMGNAFASGSESLTSWPSDNYWQQQYQHRDQLQMGNAFASGSESLTSWPSDNYWQQQYQHRDQLQVQQFLLSSSPSSSLSSPYYYYSSYGYY